LPELRRAVRQVAGVESMNMSNKDERRCVSCGKLLETDPISHMVCHKCSPGHVKRRQREYEGHVHTPSLSERLASGFAMLNGRDGLVVEREQ